MSSETSQREDAAVSPAQAGNGEFRRLFESLPFAAYTCDPEGRITWFNQHAVQLWGRSPRLLDAGDRFCGSFRLYDTDGGPIAHDQCWMARALHEDREFIGLEILVEQPDGRRVSTLAHASPIHDPSGRLVAGVNVLVDITERRNAERVLTQADRARNEFLSTLAHELRNPLAPIRNAAKILELQGEVGREGRWALDVIHRQLDHMTRLIDDLLDVARLASNRLELRLGRMTLAEAIQSAVEASAPLLESAGLELAVSLPPGTVYLDGDLIRLTQVFSNLLDNAARFTERGGRVWIEACAADGHVRVCVRDTGIGIPAERLGGIFEVFATETRPPGRASSGLGVGLLLARRLVELHGGEICARSEGPGRGSEFEVRLPMAPGESTAARAEGEPAPAEASHVTRILVVDDNRDSATSLAMLLRAMGHFVRAAYDGVEALEAAEDFLPQVVLLDIGLPRMNGYDVARSIRHRPWGANALLIAVTGWGQEVDRLRSRDAGFDHHFVKPIDLAALGELLAEPDRRA